MKIRADIGEATTLPEPGDAKVLYVLDVSGYVFRAYHASSHTAFSNSKGEPTNAVLVFTNMLLKLIRQQQPALFAAAMDSKGPTFRKEMYPAYKANRPPPPPDLSQQMSRCREIIEAYEVPVLSQPGVEADDLIASLVRRAKDKGLKVVIVSADKDLLQLVEPGVLMYDTSKDRVFGEAETVAKMGVSPRQVRDLLALMGDSSDNVPGVPSVGPKTAQGLLQQYGDLDGVYAHVDEISRKALKAKLKAHRDEAYLSQKLVSLRDDLEVEADPDRLRWSGGDTTRLRNLFTELEFKGLLGQLEPEDKPLPAGTYDLVMDEAALKNLVGACRQAGQLALFTAIEDDDPLRGELCGLGMAVDAKKSFYLPLGHRYLGAPEQLSMERAMEVLGPVLGSTEVKKKSADLKRDDIVLKRYGVDLRGGAFDTTLGSYLLEAGRHAHTIAEVARSELGAEIQTYDQVTQKRKGMQKALSQVEVEAGRDYGAQRAAITWALSDLLGPRIEREGFQSLLLDVEIPLAHVLADMEAVGILLDQGHLRRMSKTVAAELSRLEKKCHELAGREFNVASPRQLETILFDELELRVIKKTKTARSTNHAVLEELALEHPLPEAILEHRTLAKLMSTYIDALPRQVSRETGRVHTVFNQSVAATGRLSSSDPNLQNIPIRTELGRSIRNAFVAQEGFLIYSADYSQIELRVLAHLSGDPELVDAFTKGEDVHVRTAMALFDCEAQKVTREQRGQAKTVNFAVIYGQSHFALAANLGIERRDAMRYIEAFFERYSGVRQYMEDVVEEARRTGAVHTILGRRRNLPDLESANRALRQAAERIARNTPIQGSAADIMKVAMIRIHRALLEQTMRSRMLLTVHDELVFEALPEEKNDLEALVRAHMEGAVELDVPLLIDEGWGKSWGEAH